mmetsp:Transcript_28152/g.42604  ORF Transcript_28152/g.42604 Transcript_28152/m.42604 type:complete len:84 (-) Transcript_28152:415-666(-)
MYAGSTDEGEGMKQTVILDGHSITTGRGHDLKFNEKASNRSYKPHYLLDDGFVPKSSKAGIYCSSPNRPPQLQGPVKVVRSEA